MSHGTCALQYKLAQRRPDYARWLDPDRIRSDTTAGAGGRRAFEGTVQFPHPAEAATTARHGGSSNNSSSSDNLKRGAESLVFWSTKLRLTFDLVSAARP
jgi:hypothetical protein